MCSRHSVFDTMYQAEAVPESGIEPPVNFNFPFSPYEIQKDFMKALFTALHEKKLGIFESPTGTVSHLYSLCHDNDCLLQKTRILGEIPEHAMRSFDLAGSL